MTQLLILECPCDEAVSWATQALARAGLHVTSSFDLRATRAAHTNCPCPYHDTTLCDCQMVVLLVYDGNNSRPATLVAHGRDGRTWLSLADAPEERPSPQLEATIMAAIVPDYSSPHQPASVNLHTATAATVG